MADVWVLASEKRVLEKRIEELKKELRDQVHWKTEYMLLRDRLENPHCYDSKGSPTPEALEKPKGGPIYSAPPVEPDERRRVVTIRERMLELASAFFHRSENEELSDAEREAWKRAYTELVVLRHHGMDRPDLPLCLKCGGTGTMFPTALEWVETDEHNHHHKMRDGKPMVEIRRKCDCQGGFDPNGDIDEIIDD
jgi:hypothetical protein